MSLSQSSPTLAPPSRAPELIARRYASSPTEHAHLAARCLRRDKTGRSTPLPDLGIRAAPLATSTGRPATRRCATDIGTRRHSKTIDHRREWEQATQHSRHLAIAADAELRRRHPSHLISCRRQESAGISAPRRMRVHRGPWSPPRRAATARAAGRPPRRPRVLLVPQRPGDRSLVDSEQQDLGNSVPWPGAWSSRPAGPA